MYKAIRLSRYFVITKDNQICTDRHIKTKNSFNLESEVQEICDNLNGVRQEIKTILCDVDALEMKR